jgi:acylphosphatase
LRAHYVAYGTVQGVGFRWFTQRAARRLGLAGYVRNRPDGAVELEAEGPAERVAELIHTVQQGPPGAHIDRLEPIAPSSGPLEEPFAIRR